MFVFNVNLTKNKMNKILVFSIIALFIIITFLVILNNRSKKNKSNTTDSYLEVTDKNYTNVLDACYKNPELYFGKKIKFTGFVYRLFDFNENQFVLAREMIVDKVDDNHARAVVVGFLCNWNDASSFSDGDWVEVDGTIVNGFYHSQIPVLEITSAKKTACPENPFVYPPEEGYVITE